MAASNEDWGGETWDGGGATAADHIGAGKDNFGQDNGGGLNDAGDEGGMGNDACFSCGETGHRKAECTNRETRGPITCNQCGQEGHIRSECTAPREINREHVKDVSVAAAWEKLTKAAFDKDAEDAKEAIQEYVKALGGEPTYKAIQQGLITENIDLWFIGLEKPLSGAFTNMDLQGHVGKTYTVNVRFSKKPSRGRERDNWPETVEEILKRLEDAGDAVESMKQRCYNCDEYGHTSNSCPEEKCERGDRKENCTNCSGEHRTRNCTEPRIDRNACKNCGESGHRANECPEPPDPSKMTCRKCEETGHMARDCPQGGGSRSCHNCGEEGHISKECPNPKVIKCRNCDEEGHTGRECPKPKDWSRVQCSNCQQFGHTKVRCKEPTAEEDNDGTVSFGHETSTGDFGNNADGDGWVGGDTYAGAGDDGGW